MEGGSFYRRNLSGPMHVGFPGGSTPPSATPYYPPQQTPPFYHQPAMMENQGEKLDKILSILDSQGKAIDELKSDVEKMKGKQESATSFPATKATLQPEISCCKPDSVKLAVKHLHEKSNAQRQFKGSQKYDSKHNQEVKRYFIDALSEKFSPKYSPKRIKKAIHRYYESRRRLFNDEKPARKEKAAKVKAKAQKTQQRKRLYSMRKKHLKTPAEERLWKEITWEFMSEESCVEDDDSMINKHPMPFRSEALNELILKLDRRASKKEIPKFGFKKKVRIVKSPSKLPCPCEAPEWAIQSAGQNETSTSSVSLSTAIDSTSDHSNNSDSCDSQTDSD